MLGVGVLPFGLHVAERGFRAHGLFEVAVAAAGRRGFGGRSCGRFVSFPPPPISRWWTIHLLVAASSFLGLVSSGVAVASGSGFHRGGRLFRQTEMVR